MLIGIWASYFTLDDMKGIFRALLATVLFFAFGGAFVIWIAPFFTTKDLSASLGRPAESRVPVLLYAQEGGRPIFLVTQLRSLEETTRKHPGHSFLLPTGSNEIVDQSGDPASYTAREIRPGRQFVQLKALVGDYVYNVEYESDAKRVFPLRAEFKDDKQGAILAVPVSLLLTWLVMRLTRRRGTTGPGPDSH